MNILSVTSPAATAWLKSLLLAGVAVFSLAACERGEPTPDPVPEPPTPQTMEDEVSPGIYPAIFVYPAGEPPLQHDSEQGQSVPRLIQV